MNSISEVGMTLKQKAEQIYSEALSVVRPEDLLKNSVSIHGGTLDIQGEEFDLDKFENFYLASIGKAAPYMTKGFLDILGDRIKEGVSLYLPEKKITFQKIVNLPASHPLPDEKSLRAAEHILKMANKIGDRDLIFVLISGGGSAQLSLPAEGILLEEKRDITERLLKAGADIKELNTVRKHLSQIKGGRLARAAFPGTVFTLVISDVIHNDLETIASGPTYWDFSTYWDASQVLQKYGLWDSAPSRVKNLLEKGILGRLEETLKKENPLFRRIRHFIIGDNKKALSAARKKAEELGFRSFVLTSSDSGEARTAARHYCSLFSNLLVSGKSRSSPVCLLAGGELTVSVKGSGKGGRNQEFVLASLLEMEKRKIETNNWLILSLGSDGIDGPTDAAGAYILPSSMEAARSMSLDPAFFLDNNDSYNFFNKIKTLIRTGPTLTNVMDFRMFLYGI